MDQIKHGTNIGYMLSSLVNRVKMRRGPRTGPQDTPYQGFKNRQGERMTKGNLCFQEVGR